MNTLPSLTRRRFLARGTGLTAAAVAFPTIISSNAIARAGRVPPGDKIAVGCIGVGNMGTGDMQQFLHSPDTQVVAVCDVKRDRRELAQNIINTHYGNQDCTTTNEFWELTERDDIDAVLIASLDSWHVLHALAAVRAGKDVYVEKPLGMSIDEIKVLRQEVHRYGRVFQFGTQQRSAREFRFACELVRNGRIGKLKAVKVGVHAGDNERSGKQTYVEEPVPESLDYDLWLGPAPKKPYTTARLTHPHWFHISDYSLGYVSGWGIHHIDIAQWGMGMDDTGPVDIEGHATYPDADALCDNPLNWDVMMRYANGLDLRFTGSGAGFAGVRHGITFEGEDGWVWVNRGQIDAEPKSLLRDTIGPAELHLPVSVNQQQNLLDCIRSRGKTVSNIDVAVRSDTVCQLAWIAFRLGRKLRWDPDAETFVNDPEANRMLRRDMRPPWHV